MKVFDHTSCFTCDAMKNAYMETMGISDEELVNRFKICSVNGASIDSVIEGLLFNIVKNEAGRETLRLIVSRLYPFVVCASSLEKLSNSIPVDRQDTVSSVSEKVKNVTLLCNSLGIVQGDVFDSFLHIDAKLNGLKSNPVVFPAPLEKSDVKLLKVFKDNSNREENDQKLHIVNEINCWWDFLVKDAIDRVLPILRECMFSLGFGLSTCYQYSTANHTFLINLSKNRSSISARCITGPLICRQIERITVPICYALKDKKVDYDACLHHEIFHHLVIGLELSSDPFFGNLIRKYVKHWC
ncbi:MAG: hypothetical protein E7015_04025 [Alphaproteobacteria bacterium]|nr:hypothetical protein [Alphaproteobacteria bacterium]